MMGFKKNIPLLVLQKIANRDAEILTTYLAEGCSPSTIVDYTKLAAAVGITLEKLHENLNQMVIEKLVILKNGDLVRGINHHYVNGITSDGRILLERLENNRFRKRAIDWAFGAAGAIAVGLAIAYLGHFAGWNN